MKKCRGKNDNSSPFEFKFTWPTWQFGWLTIILFLYLPLNRKKSYKIFRVFVSLVKYNFLDLSTCTAFALVGCRFYYCEATVVKFMKFIVIVWIISKYVYMYVGISCSSTLFVLCAFFIMLFSRQMWGKMYKSTEYWRTTMSFFSEKSVLQCGLHKMTELYWHLLRCMVLYIAVKKILTQWWISRFYHHSNYLEWRSFILSCKIKSMSWNKLVLLSVFLFGVWNQIRYIKKKLSFKNTRHNMLSPILLYCLSMRYLFLDFRRFLSQLPFYLAKWGHSIKSATLDHFQVSLWQQQLSRCEPQLLLIWATFIRAIVWKK